jgi:hypothetical protein
MLKFRAVLIDPANTTAERPTATNGNSRPVIEQWAKDVLEKAVSLGARVEIFEIFERHVLTVRKEEKA